MDELAVAEELLVLEFAAVMGLPDVEDDSGWYGGGGPYGGGRMMVDEAGSVRVSVSVSVVVGATLLVVLPVPVKLPFVAEDGTLDVEFVAVIGDPSVEEEEVEGGPVYEPYLGLPEKLTVPYPPGGPYPGGPWPVG